MVRVHLVTADKQAVVYTVDVPSDADGWPEPIVVVYEGAYFIGPVYSADALAEYALVSGYAVERKASFLSE